MTVLHRKAHAKINLHLHITGKRADGYHLLESLMSFASLADTVSVEAADALELKVKGPFAYLLEGDNSENILLQTAKLLAEKAGREAKVSIRLDKVIPVGAGIGGGSADAAALMHLLHALWQLPFSEEEMRAVGLQIGADVPICYTGKTALVTGVGEHIQQVPFPYQFAAVLVNPLQSLSTIAVFKQGVKQFTPAAADNGIPKEKQALLEWLCAQGNDLQPPATQLMPVIPEIIEALASQEGCVLARMSGSGATCFGLFVGEEEAEKAAHALRALHPHWFVQQTVIGDY